MDINPEVSITTPYYETLAENNQSHKFLEPNKSVIISPKDREDGFRVMSGPITEDYGGRPTENVLEIASDNGETLSGEHINFRVEPLPDGNISISNPHPQREMSVWIYGKEMKVRGGETITVPMAKPDNLKDNPDIEDGVFYVTSGKDSVDRAVKISRKPLSNELKITNLPIDKESAEVAEEKAPEAPQISEKNVDIEWENNVDGIYPLVVEDQNGKLEAKITAEGEEDFNLNLPDGEFAWVKYQKDANGVNHSGNINMKPGMYFKLKGRLFYYLGMFADRSPHVVEVRKIK